MSLLLEEAPLPLFVALAIVTAVGYAGATVGMKLASGSASWIALATMILGFAAAALAEIVLMRKFDVSLIYIVVIATETLLVFCFAAWLGEAVTPLKILGAALIVGGVVLSSI